MKTAPFKNNARAGFALVITLITIVLLTIMAVAFLTSASLDQVTARAAANKANADLAAEAAVHNAMARLVDNFINYPDSATGWEQVRDSSNVEHYEGTVLYYHEQPPQTLNNPPPATSTPTPPLYVLPLLSGAVPQPTPIPGTTSTANADARKTALLNSLPLLDDTNSYDLNHRRFADDSQGWIGASPTPSPSPPPPTNTPTPPPFRGKWIEQKNSNGTVTSRYAYWMEDESFKANTNLMGMTARGSTSLGDSPTQLALQGVLPSVIVGPANYDQMAQEIFTARSKFPSSLFYGYRQLNETPTSPTFDYSKLADNAKFESTIFSGALNLSRSASKRVNLNKVVADSTDGAAIRTQLDQIIKAISYHLPNFAQRFYRTGTDPNTLDVLATGSPSDQTIYLNKIAANIRDYIDTDSQPTIVNNDSGLTINIGTPPIHSLPGGGASGANEVIAIGKESVPFLNEYMLRIKQIEFTILTPTSAHYKIEIDHYLEFWNITNKDINLSDLGPNPFLRIANQFAWDATGSSTIRGDDIPEGAPRDFSIPLSAFTDSGGNSVVFKAGSATVLTTDPLPLPLAFNVDNSRLFRPAAGIPPASFRVYQGTTYKKGSYLQLSSVMRPSANGSDSSTEVILGNDNGVIDSFGAPSVANMSVDINTPTKMDVALWHFRDSSLAGTIGSPFDPATPSQPGDPRTKNEQITLSTASDDDHTRYISRLSTSILPGKATITSLNASTVDPSLWPDPSVNTTMPIHATAPYAPAVVSNANLTSIGELGNIFDPARKKGASGDIKQSRGGGRTLTIGQSDRFDAGTNAKGLWDGNSNSSSREWTAWRLADIFATSDSVQLDGRININGISRDGGAALRAALYGYLFQPTPLTDPQIAGTSLTDTAIQKMIDQLKARIANDPTVYPQFSLTAGPLFERGELSEMPIFNTGVDLDEPVDTATVYDRGREELFRRMAELITTRGNIFTVYAVGQSLVPQPAGSTTQPVVTSTSQMKITFRIDPVWNSGTPADPFDPTTNTRFNKPDKYAIKILYAGE